MFAHRIAAAAMAAGLGGITLAGGALLVTGLAGPASASSPLAVSPSQASSTAATDPPAAGSPTVIVLPSSTAGSTGQSTQPAPSGIASTSTGRSPVPTAVRSSASSTRPKSSATPTSTGFRGSVLPTATRSPIVYRTYAPPVYAAPTYSAYPGTGTSTYTGSGTGTGSTESGSAYPYSGAAGDVPSGAAATGQPLTTATVKPSTKADPVYGSAATGAITTQHKYIDVSGFSVNGILADGAIAGAALGLVGGFGLWFTRGAR